MAVAGNGSELDWFLFETKMRNLVRELLEPVVERNEQESERYLILDKRQQALVKRLETIEFALLNEDPPSADKPIIPFIEVDDGKSIGESSEEQDGPV